MVKLELQSTRVLCHHAAGNNLNICLRRVLCVLYEPMVANYPRALSSCGSQHLEHLSETCAVCMYVCMYHTRTHSLENLAWLQRVSDVCSLCREKNV
jgi:hypothetical protein